MLEVGQIGYYILGNKLHSAVILSRKIVENQREWNDCFTKEQQNMYCHFGPSGVTYLTVHGEIQEENMFSSKHELAKSFFNTSEVFIGEENHE